MSAGLKPLGGQADLGEAAQVAAALSEGSGVCGVVAGGVVAEEESRAASVASVVVAEEEARSASVVSVNPLVVVGKEEARASRRDHQAEALILIALARSAVPRITPLNIALPPPTKAIE